jgi:hypothetical protein
MGASTEYGDPSAGRAQAVVLQSAAVLGGLGAGCGRTGAGGGPNRVVHSASGPRHGSQLVSTKSLGEVQSRITTRMGAPQVGQQATRGGEGVCRGGWLSMGRPCALSRRMVASGMAPLAWRKPQWRTFMKPCGKTCWRNLRINSMTSRDVGRRRTRPTFREVKVPVRSCRLTRRWWEMATLKT